MKKRTVTAMTALSMVLAFGGCSGKNTAETTEAVTTQQATEATTTQQATEATTTQQATEAATTQQATKAGPMSVAEQSTASETTEAIMTQDETEAPTTTEVTEEDTSSLGSALSELSRIKEDDATINLIRVASYTLLADEVFYRAASNIITLDVDVANKTMKVSGLGDLKEDFINEINTLMFDDNKTTFEQFISDSYKTDGSKTKLVFQWNPTLYTWDFVVTNNIPGSRYFDEEQGPGTDQKTGGKTVIRVMAFLQDEAKLIKKYFEMHPEFAAKYDVSFTYVATDDGAYINALEEVLEKDDEMSPNLYMAEASFVKRFTTGSSSSYACTYEELGIDVEQKIKDAGIATYVADVTRRNGKVTGLAYMGCGCVFIYNREVAEDVFGDDKPETVEAAIGSNWESFFAAAEKCKEKGYAIVSGDGDIWHAIENSADHGWVVDGKLYIDPKREAFLDLSKRLKDNNYHNDTMDWCEGWFADMAEAGPKKVLGFYGPSWLINYTLPDHTYLWDYEEEKGGTYGQWGVCKANVGSFWGGTWLIANKNVLQDEDLKAGVRELIEYMTLDTSDTGAQYLQANDLVREERSYLDRGVAYKIASTSATVMERSDGKLDILGGQNAFPYYIEANAAARGDNLTEYDEWIGYYWRDAVRSYTSGERTREEAIQWFKEAVGSYGYFTVE